MTIPPKVGIFIAGDNVSASHAERINQIAGTVMANHKMSAKAGGFRSWRQFFLRRPDEYEVSNKSWDAVFTLKGKS